MAVATYEGIVEEGKIIFKAGVRLPENIKVYVIVPEMQPEKKKTARVATPRLTRRKQVSDFKMKITKQ